MPKYRFIYTVNEGKFQLDVDTGVVVIAQNQTKAMESAERLEQIISDRGNFQVVFKLLPQPHITVKTINPFGGNIKEPSILEYKIQGNLLTDKKFLGLSVYSDDDFFSLPSNIFIENMVREYEAELISHDRNSISFDTTSYRVQLINNPENNLRV